jgi:hypothetical protein
MHTLLKILRGALLQVRLLALPTNIKLGWKCLPVTNTLAYYENSKVTAVKSFITLTSDAAQKQPKAGRLSLQLCPRKPGDYFVKKNLQ